jgi:hypothetical protein
MAADDAETLYAAVDAAADDRLYGLIQLASEKQCLFAGEIDPVLARASPWFVALTPQDHLFHAWRDIGRDKAWGILMRSRWGFRDVRRHLRHFMQVMLPAGDVVMFRFYDPRVFKVYLPTCTPEELAKWYKGVSAFVVETGEGGNFHEFRFDGQQLTDSGQPVRQDA